MTRWFVASVALLALPNAAPAQQTPQISSQDCAKITRLAEGHGPAGVLLDDALTIACGQGALQLIDVQRAGKAPMKAEEFLRGTPVKPGARLA